MPPVTVESGDDSWTDPNAQSDDAFRASGGIVLDPYNVGKDSNPGIDSDAIAQEIVDSYRKDQTLDDVNSGVYVFGSQLTVFHNPNRSRWESLMSGLDTADLYQIDSDGNLTYQKTEQGYVDSDGRFIHVIAGFPPDVGRTVGLRAGSWISRKVFKDLAKNKQLREKFITAMKKGVVGPVNQSGIKVLKNGGFQGYTHELKVMGSASRLLGKYNEQGVLVFEKFVAGGLH